MLGSPLIMEEVVAALGSSWYLEIGPAPTVLARTVAGNHEKRKKKGEFALKTVIFVLKGK